MCLGGGGGGGGLHVPNNQLLETFEKLTRIRVSTYQPKKLLASNMVEILIRLT